MDKLFYYLILFIYKFIYKIHYLLFFIYDIILLLDVTVRRFRPENNWEISQNHNS